MLSQPTSASADPVEFVDRVGRQLDVGSGDILAQVRHGEVPGMSRIVAECCSSHASATCRGDAPGDVYRDRLGPHHESHKRSTFNRFAWLGTLDSPENA